MSQIQFNDREISFNWPSSYKSKTARMKGEIIVCYSDNGAGFLFKSDKGELSTNYLGYRFSYQDGHFVDKPKFLDAMKRLGVVTEEEIKTYKANNKIAERRQRLRYYARELERMAKEAGMKLTKSQIKLVKQFQSTQGAIL